jgi:hypothetical protein
VSLLKRIVIASILISANIVLRPAAADTVGPVQIFTPSEFSTLSSDDQAVFVGGLIEGMAFVSYGYSLASHDAWSACVQQKTIGDTTADVVAFLKGSGFQREHRQRVCPGNRQTL